MGQSRKVEKQEIRKSKKNKRKRKMLEKVGNHKKET